MYEITWDVCRAIWLDANKIMIKEDSGGFDIYFHLEHAFYHCRYSKTLEPENDIIWVDTHISNNPRVVKIEDYKEEINVTLKV